MAGRNPRHLQLKEKKMLEMLEEISNLIVAGTAENGSIVIEWRGVDLRITVTRDDEGQ
jgi:DNA-binding protein YbaB